MKVGKGALRAAVFLRRLNRFAAAVHMDGREVAVHLPNSGRLGELLTPGRPGLVAPALPRASGHRGRKRAQAPTRRTLGDLVFLLGPQGWVSVDARLPGRLLAEAVQRGRLEALRDFRVVRLEYRPPYARDCRLDLLLEGPSGQAAVETKSVTLVAGATALFPDAPTLRGRRHLQTLVEARRQGQHAFAIFVVQRPDAVRFAPHREADPEFARALLEAVQGGVVVQAYACRVRPPFIEIERELPVVLDHR